MKKQVFAGCLLAVATLFSGPASAGTVSFTGLGVNTTGGVNASLSARVQFDWTATQLTVTLKNAAPLSVNGDVPSSVLTGVFWNLVPNIALTQVSATVAAGSIIQGNTCSVNPNLCGPTQTNVGGEFAYGAPVSVAEHPGADRGISTAGLGVFGQANFPNAPNLDGQTAVQGFNFGIVSANYSTVTANGGLAGKPLIKDTVKFVFTGSLASLKETDFNNVSFQYGTALNEPKTKGNPEFNPSTVPEPGTLALMFASLLGLTSLRRRAVA